MLHDDGTMDVEIDGRIERRRFTMQMPPLGALYGSALAQPEPELRAGERAVWGIGDDKPIIIKGF